jgi:hypothetical protein
MPGMGELMILLVLPMFGFWIWMLVDCLTKEVPSERLLWTLVIILTGVIGALIYLIVRRSKRPATA